MQLNLLIFIFTIYVFLIPEKYNYLSIFNFSIYIVSFLTYNSQTDNLF